MGYELHITRAEEWSESELCPIELHEWLQLVERDPDLVPQESGLEGFVLWTGWSRGGVRPPMWHSEGCIVSSAPEPEVAAKMHEPAQQLGARVVGDEGEEFDAAGRQIDAPDDDDDHDDDGGGEAHGATA